MHYHTRLYLVGVNSNILFAYQCDGAKHHANLVGVCYGNHIYPVTLRLRTALGNEQRSCLTKPSTVPNKVRVWLTLSENVSARMRPVNGNAGAKILKRPSTRS